MSVGGLYDDEARGVDPRMGIEGRSHCEKRSRWIRYMGDLINRISLTVRAPLALLSDLSWLHSSFELTLILHVFPLDPRDDWRIIRTPC